MEYGKGTIINNESETSIAIITLCLDLIEPEHGSFSELERSFSELNRCLVELALAKGLRNLVRLYRLGWVRLGLARVDEGR